MAALNYYAGLQRGAGNNIYKVVSGTSSGGTAVDVEVRMQMNDGTNAIPLTKKDVETLLDTLCQWILSNGLNHAGANLPPI